ncbi:hypothetical protein OG311_18780 [Streptomyces sp. NBC_01343]|uniref:hypothetical protein n=1 Tax=Streptomyces sp. NBC_01343 TaxID=2903832 RepID=UPI002E15DD5B|nr:hypothetical protein OG311_18780 [Streptomyces sp. NBC_01343]
MAESAPIALPVRLGGYFSTTVAQAADSRNHVIILGVILSCVIGGDTVTGVLQQATWLVIAVVVLIMVRTVEALALRGGWPWARRC